MNESLFGFSLSRGDIFPCSVNIRGIEYAIDADFRNILKIFRLLADDELLTWDKYSLLCRFFYPGGAPNIAEGVTAFAGFVSCEAMGKGFANGSFANGSFANGGSANGGSANMPGERQFDFEFDAAEIYQSFYAWYRIDLAEIPFLHFYKFLVLLAGLGRETPFVEKIRLRFMDLRGMKGAELARMSALKERVRLPEKLSREELAELAEFERVWGGF